ncbi:YlbF family regulator [Cohnella caldifontis]|uniref:YlbF family regulator n=1 Tax=Cohnella caldifontis TaxID=3027471 RepID=UPI0023EAFE9A|nr:YlbF family regulator [Cohnella sp. YIM B05605]
MAVLPDLLPTSESVAADPAPADFTELLEGAYALGEMIKRSALADDYVYWKRQVEQDPEAGRLKVQLAKAKERFEECERFGRFHPDYNEALDRVYAVQAELDRLESVRRYKIAESGLDQLLYEISSTLASAVSDSVKVPDPVRGEASGGCGSGGACSCGGGGCG